MLFPILLSINDFKYSTFNTIFYDSRNTNEERGLMQDNSKIALDNYKLFIRI